MRQRFDGQLALLNRELINMGALCEEAIAVTARSVLDADRKQAERISALEEEIDQKEREIERICLRLLLQQQPVAGDLRQISAALKMITDMERIGDQALDIAETAGFMGPLDERTRGYSSPFADSRRHGHGQRGRLRQPRPGRRARAVARAATRPKVSDQAIKSAMIERLSRRPGDGEYALDLLMIAKYLERIGDHATNIAEWVEFAATGLYKGREML
ncbi:MAG: phosphate signaling complex PhoU family protein [Oscillospiraceae bacterium]